MEAEVPESVPGTKVPLTPPKLAVIPVALFALMATIIMAARFAPFPTTNGGVLALVTLHWNPELIALSNAAPALCGELMVRRMAPDRPTAVHVLAPVQETPLIPAPLLDWAVQVTPPSVVRKKEPAMQVLASRQGT